MGGLHKGIGMQLSRDRMKLTNIRMQQCLLVLGITCMGLLKGILRLKARVVQEVTLHLYALDHSYE